MTIVDQTNSSQLTEATAPSRRPRRRQGPLTRLRARVTNPDWGHLAPLLLVAIAIGFNLYVLRGELASVADLNDTGVHISMVRWAEQRLSSGSLVFDGWYPRLALGLPQFHHYQSLPHILGGAIATVVGAERTVTWSYYLLLSFWPLCLYLTVRLFGFGRWTAGCTAVLAPLASSVTLYGYEHGSYTWRGQRRLVAALRDVALPVRARVHLARGLPREGLRARRPVPRAHHRLPLPHRVLRDPGPRHLGARIAAARSSAGSGAPRSSGSAVRSARPGSSSRCSWTASGRRARSTTSTPSGRTRTAAARSWSGSSPASCSTTGAGRCSACSSASARSCAAGDSCATSAPARILCFTILGLLLFCGRDTIGFAIDLLPGGKDLLLHRFIIPVHLGGLLLAGIGSSWLVQGAYARVSAWKPRLSPFAIGVPLLIVGLVVLTPAFRERAHFDSEGATWINQQRVSDRTSGRDFTALAKRADALGGGRVYAGSASGGSQYKVGYVPGYSYLLDTDVDAVGFTLRTLSPQRRRRDRGSTTPTRRSSTSSTSATSSSRRPRSRPSRRTLIESQGRLVAVVGADDRVPPRRRHDPGDHGRSHQPRPARRRLPRVLGARGWSHPGDRVRRGCCGDPDHRAQPGTSAARRGG